MAQCVDYQQVLSVFDASCMEGCHANGVGGTSLTYTELTGNNSSACDVPYLIPGDANASYLFDKVNDDGDVACGSAMPFGPGLPDSEVQLLRDWIDGGAIETIVNGCTDASASNFNPDANCDDGSCEFATSAVGCPTVIVDFEDDSTLPNLPPFICEGDMIEICFGTDCADCDLTAVDFQYSIEGADDPGLTASQNGTQVCFGAIVPPPSGDACSSYDLAITIETVNTNDPECESGNIAYLITNTPVGDLEGTDLNEIIPLLALFDANPLVVKVYPLLDVVITEPTCDGGAGSAQLLAGDTECASATGSAGMANECPETEGVDGALSYDFTADVDSVVCINGDIAGEVTVACSVECQEEGCPTLLVDGADNIPDVPDTLTVGDPLELCFQTDCPDCDLTALNLEYSIEGAADPGLTLVQNGGEICFVTTVPEGADPTAAEYILTLDIISVTTSDPECPSGNIAYDIFVPEFIPDPLIGGDFNEILPILGVLGILPFEITVFQPQAPTGCTDPCAPNYDPAAEEDDGSCEEYDTTCDDGCDLTVDSYDFDNCQCVNTAPNPDDGCELTEDIFDEANCIIVNTPPDVDDGCELTEDSFDADNCLIVNTPPAVDDGCELTNDAFDAAACVIINEPVDVSDDCPLDLEIVDLATCSVVVEGPDTDDGCDITTDSFDADACAIVNTPNCPDGTTFDAANCLCSEIPVGCTDATACNFDPNAVEDNGSCTFLGDACEDNGATGVLLEDCSCFVEALGCTNPDACNFDANANTDDGSCFFEGDACGTNGVIVNCICDETITGCTDPCSPNYNPAATEDDGSCTPLLGCTDSTAVNYDPAALCDDGSCIAAEDGCTDADACNYDADANIDDGSCFFEGDACGTNGVIVNCMCDETITGCTDPCSANYNPAATEDDGSCTPLLGCTDSGASNYDATALCDDGSCVFPQPEGCTDPAACNYDPNAIVDNGTCFYGVDACPQPCNAVIGCTDPAANNYDATANCDLNDECEYDPTDPCETNPVIIQVEYSCNQNTGEATLTINVSGGTGIYSVSGDLSGTFDSNANSVITIEGDAPFVSITAVDGNNCSASFTQTYPSCTKVSAVELMDFAGRLAGSNNLISWTTASEYNSDHFAVQRSIDGVTFETIGKVQAAENSNMSLNYEFVDADVLPRTYFYRLEMFDLDGSSELTNIVSLERRGGVSIAPVPAQDNIQLTLTNNKEVEAYIEIIDATGKLMTTQIVALQEGINQVDFNISDYSVGLYFVKVKLGTEVYIERLLKD